MREEKENSKGSEEDDERDGYGCNNEAVKMEKGMVMERTAEAENTGRQNKKSTRGDGEIIEASKAEACSKKQT